MPLEGQRNYIEIFRPIEYKVLSVLKANTAKLEKKI